MSTLPEMIALRHVVREGTEIPHSNFWAPANPWAGIAIQLMPYHRSSVISYDLNAAIKLRDWLTQVIDAAGTRPLHPLVFDLHETINRAGSHPEVAALVEINDRLYELDERRQREAQL